MVSTNMESNVKFSITELIETLDKIVYDNREKQKLIGYIGKGFIEKGLFYHIPQQIFSDGLDLEKLETVELMQFTKSAKEFLKLDILKLENYFSNAELIAYDTYVPPQEEIPDYVLFKCATKLNAKSYSTPLYPTKSSEMRKYRQYMYYKPAQRPAKNIVRKGKVVGTKENVNKKGVQDLTERFIEGDIFPTSIAFSVLRYEGKKIGIVFEPYEGFDNIGDLKIYPCWDKEDPNYTPFISNDGYHRLTANADSYDVTIDNTGEIIETPLVAIINIMTEAEAKQYVQDSFKRNYADLEELKAMSPSNENNFVSSIIDKSEVLKDKVATTFKNIKITDSYTSKDILAKAIKISNFDIVDEIESELQSEKVAKIVDLIVNRLCKEYYSNNIREMELTNLLAINMFVGYFAIADVLKSDSKYISKMVKIVDELFLRTEEFNTLKLNNKSCNVELVYEYFKNLVAEVI